MMKRLVLAFLLILTGASALATKPCPPPPCWTPKSDFDAAVCEAKADWIATGHITKLIHHPTDRPLSKDMTEFTFVVDHWIKGGDKLPRVIPFHTGWCTNSETMQTDSGTFRFWGKNKPDVVNAEWEFLHFEKIPK